MSEQPITDKEREARRERARANGRKGGRPPKTAWNAEQKLREKARERGESYLSTCVEYWIELVEGKHAKATHDHRLRAAENLANRCGLPIRTEQNVTPGLPVKTVNLEGFVAPNGSSVSVTFGPESLRASDPDVQDPEASAE